MNWIDIILDHVSEYKLENISKIEKRYLEEYDTPSSKDLEDVLNERVKYYRNACDYNIKEAFFYDEEFWPDLTDDDIKETRLNILWDILLDDDFETFIKIYKVPMAVLSSDWKNLSERYKQNFEDYWKSYYNFNI